MKRLADEASTTRLRYSFFPLARGGTGFRERGRVGHAGFRSGGGFGSNGGSRGGAVNETAALHFIDSTLVHIHTTTARHQSPISLARLPPARRSADYSHPSIGLQSNAPSDALSAR